MQAGVKYDVNIRLYQEKSWASMKYHITKLQKWSFYINKYLKVKTTSLQLHIMYMYILQKVYSILYCYSDGGFLPTTLSRLVEVCYFILNM
jgi:hypothetical protein